MIHVQQGALRAFEQDGFVRDIGLTQQFGHVGDHRCNLVGLRQTGIEGGLKVDRRDVEILLEHEVVEIQRFAELARQHLAPEQIDEDRVTGALDTVDIPDPDLLIRTSGEERLSNFLLWQAAYTEFYFTDTLWPDFRGDELRLACETFAERERRFGGL